MLPQEILGQSFLKEEAHQVAHHYHDRLLELETISMHRLRKDLHQQFGDIH